MPGYTLESASSHNAEGWRVDNGTVSVFTTKYGAMSAPVQFRLPDGKTVEPYHITPWQDENKNGLPEGCLRNLRGDFFCLPFGGNAEPVNGEQHPCHGEITGRDWTLAGVSEEGNEVTVAYRIDMKIRKGSVTKKIRLRRDETVLYLSDTVSGSHGLMPVGHHPILRMPADGAKMYLSLGHFDLGMTCPGVFSNPDAKEYQYLASGAEFSSVEKIPTAFKTPAFADYSVYPSPYGYCDLFTVIKKPSDKPAWSAAVYPEEGFLWFVLKDASVLPSTNVWVSNSGRFASPWDGRTYCIGIEDSCSFFPSGLKQSSESNDLTKRGFRTAIDFDSEKEIRMIQGVAGIPSGFSKVSNVMFEDGEVVFLDASGKKAPVKCDFRFVMK